MAKNWQRFGCHTLHNILRGLSRSRCSTAHDSYRIASRTTVCPDPKAAQGMLMADYGEQMGGSPKTCQQHLAGKTSLLGVTRSLQPRLPGPFDIKSLWRGPTSLTEYLRPRKPSVSYLGYSQRGVFHKERKRQRQHCH